MVAGASGSLTVVGTGIQVAGHVTVEAKALMQQADKLLFLVADPATHYWIRRLNATAESLESYYAEGKNRLVTYEEMIERILTSVREGGSVCVAFYGHPGVFVYPGHEAVRRARLEGYPARMLPGISAEDCLFADLGIDPGTSGCQSFEATDFLVHKRVFDPHVSLVLWQIGVIGELGYRPDKLFNETGLQILVEVLCQRYPSEHEVVVYEASQYPICDPVIERTLLGQLMSARVSGISTLFVPPRPGSLLDHVLLGRLGLAPAT